MAEQCCDSYSGLECKVGAWGLDCLLRLLELAVVIMSDQKHGCRTYNCTSYSITQRPVSAVLQYWSGLTDCAAQLYLFRHCQSQSFQLTRPGPKYLLHFQPVTVQPTPAYTKILRQPAQPRNLRAVLHLRLHTGCIHALVSGTCTLRNSLKAGPYCSPDAASCWYSCTVSLGTVALALWASMLRSALRRAEFWALDNSACGAAA
jgi:hypothetical protein